MKPCISQATVMSSTFVEDIDAYSLAGCTAMEVWLTKLEQALVATSVAEIRSRLLDVGITTPAAAYQGGLLLSQGESRRAHYDDYKKRLELCQALGIGKIILVADFVGSVDPTSLERAIVSLKQSAQWAAAFDVSIALEPRGKSVFCSSLDTALALVAQAAEPNLSVALDTFHYYTGPSKLEDLRLASAGMIGWVQISDLAGVPRELASDSDRVLPGDGDLQLEQLLSAIKACGYDGYISLELFNPTFWQTPAAHVLEIGMMALKRLLKIS